MKERKVTGWNYLTNGPTLAPRERKPVIKPMDLGCLRKRKQVSEKKEEPEMEFQESETVEEANSKGQWVTITSQQGGEDLDLLYLWKTPHRSNRHDLQNPDGSILTITDAQLKNLPKKISKL